MKFPNHLAIPGVEEGVCGVWIPPASPSLITGRLRTWANESNVTPTRIPGYWTFQKTKVSAPHSPAPEISTTTPVLPGEKVIYYLHGGGYVVLSAHPVYTITILSGLLHALRTVRRVFAVEYRLSVAQPYTPTAPFPAALMDALAGYVYLVDTLGFAPEDILVVGDSAGGNLALALARYLVEHRNHTYLATPSGAEVVDEVRHIPLVPGNLLLLSPWCDLSTSHADMLESSVYVNTRADFFGMPRDLEAPGVRYAKRAFLGSAQLRSGGAERNPYISPASLHLEGEERADFMGFPRTMVVAGEAEILLSQIETLVERMVRDLGKEGKGETGKVTYYAAPDMVHDFLAFKCFEPQRSDALQAIAQWFAGSGMLPSLAQT